MKTQQKDMDAKDCLLLIFLKSVDDLQAKTRLQREFGRKKTRQIYTLLVRRTWQMSQRLPCAKAVFYADRVPKTDCFHAHVFARRRQTGENLGEKMKNAFVWGFKEGFKRIIVVGSDCYVLNEIILKNAFYALIKHDYVVGPCQDGGYYLLGMQSCEPALFADKKWGSNKVLSTTLETIKKCKKTYHLTPLLYDIDEPSDWKTLKKEYPMVAQQVGMH